MDLQPLVDLIPCESSWEWISELAQLPERMNIASQNDRAPWCSPTSQRPESLNHLSQEHIEHTSYWDSASDCYSLLEAPNLAVRVYNQDQENVFESAVNSWPEITASKNTAVAVYDRPVYESNKFLTESASHCAMASRIYGAPADSATFAIDTNGEIDSARAVPAVYDRPVYESNKFLTESASHCAMASRIYGAPADSATSALDINGEIDSASAVPQYDEVYGASQFLASSAIDLDFALGVCVTYPVSQNDLVRGAPFDFVTSAIDNGVSRKGLVNGAPVGSELSTLDNEVSRNGSVPDTNVVLDGLPSTSEYPTLETSKSSGTAGKKRKPKQKKEEKSMLALEKKHKKYAVKNPCSCKKNCSDKISLERRHEINQKFWELDYRSQKLYIRSKTTTPALKTAARNNVTYFFTTVSGQTVDVCQIFFLATLGFKPNNNTVVRDALKNEFPKPDGRGKHLNKWKFDESIVIEHILSFHPESSHYRREHAPFRKYLPSDITITKMHQLFTEQRSDKPCSYDYYRKVVDKLNISFTKLGHEMCEKCEVYEQHIHASSNCQDCIEYEQHKKFYTEARIEYDADRLVPDDPQNIVVSVDMQKVVMLPRMEQFKEVLFTKRICVFNETFAPIGGSRTLPVYASVWHEGIAGRKKEDLISCFRSFLLYNRNASTITFWSDNCTSQNKCWALFCFMVYIVNSEEISAESITMKFLEKGHTFMSADSFHHQVELAMKHSEKGFVCDFNDFVKCVQSANGQRVVCKGQNISDFADWPDWTSTSKLNKATPRPYIANISKVKFVRGKKTMFYANSFNDDWTEVDFIMAKHQGLVPPEMRNVVSGISREVKEGITRKLTQLMPVNRRAFWYDLPTKD